MNIITGAMRKPSPEDRPTKSYLSQLTGIKKKQIMICLI